MDARVAGHDRQPVAVAAGPEAPAGEQGEPGRVHELQPAQVDDQLAGARVQGVPQAPLEQRSAGEVELPGGADVDRVAPALGRAAKGFGRRCSGQGGVLWSVVRRPAGGPWRSPAYRVETSACRTPPGGKAGL